MVKDHAELARRREEEKIPTGSVVRGDLIADAGGTALFQLVSQSRVLITPTYRCTHCFTLLQRDASVSLDALVDAIGNYPNIYGTHLQT